MWRTLPGWGDAGIVGREALRPELRRKGGRRFLGAALAVGERAAIYQVFVGRPLLRSQFARLRAALRVGRRALALQFFAAQPLALQGLRA